MLRCLTTLLLVLIWMTTLRYAQAVVIAGVMRHPNFPQNLFVDKTGMQPAISAILRLPPAEYYKLTIARDSRAR